MSVSLNPGDSVYFSENYALGFLLERYYCPREYEYFWKYALRSPPRSDLTNFMVSIRSTKESMLVDSINSGRFEHYACG